MENQIGGYLCNYYSDQHKLVAEINVVCGNAEIGRKGICQRIPNIAPIELKNKEATDEQRYEEKVESDPTVSLMQEREDNSGRMATHFRKVARSSSGDMMGSTSPGSSDLELDSFLSMSMIGAGLSSIVVDFLPG